MNPDPHSLLEATKNLPSNPPPGFNASCNSSSTCTPVDTFNRSIKRDSSQFTNFKYGKYWDTCLRKTLATDRAYDVAEVLNT